MNVRLPVGLPAAHTLNKEQEQARCDLRIALVNLMPQKTAAELQFARLLAATGQACGLILVYPDGYSPRHTPVEHLNRYYRAWREIRAVRLDGVIVTGAPLEHLQFEDVSYWESLTQILDWLVVRQIPSLHICWAAMAALYHYHGVRKHALAAKMFGIFEQTVEQRAHPLFDGIAGKFPVPVSRHAEVRESDLANNGDLVLLARSDDSGVCLLHEHKTRATYHLNHFEYDTQTLLNEYQRDSGLGLDTSCPKNYFPENDPRMMPINTWKASAQQFTDNWLRSLRCTESSAAQTTGTYG